MSSQMPKAQSSRSKAPQASTVAAIVVTYNRKNVLRDTVHSLKAQTWPADEIVVVDNASSDGTEEMVRSEFPAVTYLKVADNLGFGAGLAAGMKFAFNQGHKYFWLLDDDSHPKSSALEQCMQIAQKMPRLGIVGFNGGDCRRGPNHWGEDHFKTLPDKEVYHCDFVLVDGALVTYEAVQMVGFPRDDFFMMMEDIEYSSRIKAAGWEVALNNDGLISRAHLGSGGTGGTSPPWRGYYQTRNHLVMALERRSLMELFWWCLRQIKFTLAALLHLDRKWERIRLRALGAWHGVSGKMGRTIDPAR